MPVQETYFPEAEYITLKQAKDTEYQLMDYQLFENDKGAGVAILVKDDLGLYKIITHSAPITNLFKDYGPTVQEDIDAGETVSITVRSKTSKKTGREYFYVE